FGQRAPGQSCDFDGDGDVDLNDLAILQGNYGFPSVAHPGDANGDNRVNEADLAILNDQWGLRAPGQSGDFDGDGDVDIDDFNILKGNMGWDGTGGGAPQTPGSETPEPATMSLLAIGGLLILRRRRRT
ncbi:MAG: PEP-CTERM sorting domain-containing protein, partial [Phycisphaerae bacterium]|nr:PEP-CTERM sorting domain-containing protein [Phycisphaerae bacterium]